MAKAKSAFVCTECGAEYRKWQGQCSSCQEWNTLSEVRLSAARPGAATGAASTARGGYAGGLSREVVDLASVDLSEVPRLSYSGADLLLWRAARFVGPEGGTRRIPIPRNSAPLRAPRPRPHDEAS